MMRTTAVFENGVLRPTGRPPLRDGQTVEVLLQTNEKVVMPIVEDDFSRKLAAAKSLTEIFDIANAQPNEDDGYDRSAAMNESRGRTVERLPVPLRPD